MIKHSIQPRDRIFVKGYGLLSFAQFMGKYISTTLSGKQGQKLLDHANQSAPDALKTFLERFTQKTAEATGDLIGNKIANRITKVSRYSQQNNSEIVTNEHDKEILKQKYVSRKERQEIIDGLRLKQYND